MRLFAAIPVSTEVRELVAEVLRELAPHQWPIRWVRPEAVHLTVKFYGEVPEDSTEQVLASLAEAVRGTGALPVEVGGVGVFPSAGRPRVIWLGVEAPGALEILHHRVEVGAATLGFPGDGRPYRPHLTLGRLRDRARAPRVVEETLNGITRRETFLAKRMVLYQSILSSAGADHRSVATFPLDAA